MSIAPGLTLPVLIDELNVREPIDEKRVERQLRQKMAQQVITHLEANHSAGSVHDDVLNYVKNMYELRINKLNGMLRATDKSDHPEELYQQVVRLQLELISVERMVLTEQRQSSPLDSEILRKMEQELDLEAARLSLVQAPEH